ncbi:MAG: LysR family transcriptional regulator [Burkholderiales bacterium]|nr:LysR family transcriptional regulator [Burkholderiales bacterium]
MREALDVHLLRVLHTVVTEASVSRAADRLEISQPAVSAALKRLRDLTGDAILVRTRSGMAPTARALELLSHASRALNGIDAIIQLGQKFDPATTVRTFCIAAPDYLDLEFLPRLIGRVTHLAPNAQLSVRPLTADVEYERQLEEGEIDLVVANWPNPPPYLRSSPLYDDEVVVMMRAGHPLAAAATLAAADYRSADHLAPTRYAGGVRGSIDGHLASVGVERTHRVALAYFNQVPFVLERTDLLFTTGRRFAESCLRVAPLTIRRAPLGFPPMKFYQLWHERTQDAPAARWLREQVAASVREDVARARKAPARR